MYWREGVGAKGRVAVTARRKCLVSVSNVTLRWPRDDWGSPAEATIQERSARGDVRRRGCKRSSRSAAQVKMCSV